MKKMICLLCAFVVFCALIAFVQLSLAKDAAWMDAKAAQVMNAFDRPNEAQLFYLELDARWTQHVYWWGTLLPHDNLEKVTLEVKRLGVALQTQTLEDAAQAAAAIRLQMQHLLARNTLKLDHVL